MSDREFLESRGWRIISERKTRFGKVCYWAHDDHQPWDGRFFITSTATAHQKRVDSGIVCHCIPKSAHGEIRSEIIYAGPPNDEKDE